MSHTVFLDESGDLGFKFTHPYRNGGSSRHLVMGFAVIPNDKIHLLKRIVKKVYKKYNYPYNTEVKGSQLLQNQKEFLADEITKLALNNPDILICSIAVKKENVAPHIRSDSNLLYNYMMRLSVLDRIKIYPSVKLTRDNRAVKIASGNTLINYLQTTLWFECNSQTILQDNPSDSKESMELIFIDWINNIVFNHYEDGNSVPYRTILPIMRHQTLFF